MHFQTSLLAFITWCFIPLLVNATPLVTEDKHPIEAIIFDCDGVLVDTELLKFQAWQEAAAAQGYSFSLEDYKPLVGQSGPTIALAIKVEKKKQFPDKQLNEKQLLADRNKAYKKLHQEPKNIHPITPMIQLAKNLAAKKLQHGYKLGLASSAPLAEIKANLKAHGLESTFDILISGEDDLKDIQDPAGVNKPKPYIYLRLAQWMQVSPNHCVVFEDTEAGVMAGTTAGMRVYAVPNEFTQSQNFELAQKVLDVEKIDFETLFD